MAEPRWRPIGWLLVAAWGIVILAFSSIPELGDRLPRALRFPGSDALAHFAVYGVLGGLLTFTTGRVWAAVALASAFGALDEAYQATVPGRNASVLDWLVDTVGALAGAALTLGFIRRRRGRAVP